MNAAATGSTAHEKRPSDGETDGRDSVAEVDKEEGEGEAGKLIFSTHEQRLQVFPQLRDVIYLDNAGAALPCNSQLAAATADLLASPYANPHSVGPAAALTAAAVRDVRCEILNTLFNVTPDEYVPVAKNPAAPLALPPPHLRCHRCGVFLFLVALASL
jgi:hypothetical protein